MPSNHTTTIGAWFITTVNYRRETHRYTVHSKLINIAGTPKHNNYKKHDKLRIQLSLFHWVLDRMVYIIY